MATKAFLLPSLWNDPDFKRLDAEQRVAWMWLLSNDGRNSIGFTRVQPERFTFDTGYPFPVLTSTLDTMSHSVVTASDRQCLNVLLLNFIRLQHGSGKVTKKNPIQGTIIREVCALSPDFRKSLLSKYVDIPALAALVQQSLVVTETPPVSGSHMVWNGTGTGTGMDSPYYPKDEEISRFIAEWPGELASGVPPFDPEWATQWVAGKMSRGGENSFPPNWKSALVWNWRTAFRTWANGGGSIPSRPGAVPPPKTADKKPTMWELQKSLEAVRERIDNHEANEESAAYASDSVTSEEMEELDRLRRQERELVVQISQMHGVTS